MIVNVVMVVKVIPKVIMPIYLRLMGEGGLVWMVDDWMIMAV